MLKRAIILFALFQVAMSMSAKELFNQIKEHINNILFGQPSKDEYYKQQWDAMMSSEKKNRWQPSWSIKNKYAEKLDNLLKKIKKNNDYENEGDPPKNISVPQQWRGFGAGHTGIDKVPAWAKHDKQYGRPAYCYYEKNEGHALCEQKENWTRWGFNRHNNDCEKFIFRGCGGNTNNFVSKIQCLQMCKDKVQSACCKYGDIVEY